MKKRINQTHGLLSAFFLLVALLAGLFMRGVPHTYFDLKKAEAGCGPVTQLYFQSVPNGVIEDDAFSLNVLAQDDCGETVTTDNDRSITLSILSGPSGAVFGGTLTRSTVNGVASFTGLSLDLPGSYTLQIASAGITSGSGSITIEYEHALSIVTGPAENSSVEAGTLVPIVVNILGRDGFVDTAATYSVTINENAEHIPSGTVTVNAVNGVATFNNVSFRRAGGGQFNVSSSNAQSVSSNYFTIVAGEPVKLLVTSSPAGTSIPANETFSAVFSVADQYNNVLSSGFSNEISVRLGTNTTGGVLNGSLHWNAADEGPVASFFDLAVDVGGTYTLVAEAEGLTSAETGSFTAYGPAAKLGITSFCYLGNCSAPAPGLGTSFLLEATVQDSDGRRVRNDDGREISLSIGTNPGGGSLDETTLANTNEGVASFSTSVIGSIGTYTIIATSPGLTQAESNSFVVHGSAYQVTSTSLPTSVNINTVFTTAWEIRDSGNNIVTEDSSTPVTIALYSNPTGATLSDSGSNPRTPTNGGGIFTTLSIDKAGTYTFQLTSPGLVSGTTGSLTVVDPNASSGGGNSGGSGSSGGGGSGFVGGAPPPAAWFPVPSPVNPNIVEQTKKNLLTVLANNFSRDLFIGMRSESVRLLQMFLVTKDTGPHARTLKNHGLTTYFGPLTESALKEFQKANNVPPTGYFGPKSRAAAKGK